jgi:hypothetical protein
VSPTSIYNKPFFTGRGEYRITITVITLGFIYRLKVWHKIIISDIKVWQKVPGFFEVGS